MSSKVRQIRSRYVEARTDETSETNPVGFNRITRNVEAFRGFLQLLRGDDRRENDQSISEENQ